jgi:hypothetical protein
VTELVSIAYVRVANAIASEFRSRTAVLLLADESWSREGVTADKPWR